MPEISRYAVISPGASLADDVRVGPFCYVGPQVRIGPGCVLENSVTITGKTTLGANNHVFPMAAIGVADRRAAEAGEVVIGESNAIHEHATIYSGPRDVTRVGNANMIMIACQVGPGSSLGDHIVLANCTYVGAEAVVEDHVWTSAFIMIQPKVTVGAYTMIVGYSEIDQDAPPFAMVQGPPLRVRGVNAENLKRCGFGAEDIHALKNAFRELFNGSEEQVNLAVVDKLLADPQANGQVRRLGEALRRGAAPKAGAVRP